MVSRPRPNPSFERDSPKAGCPSIQTLALMAPLVSLIAVLLVLLVIAISIPLLFLAVGTEVAAMVAHYAVACFLSALGYLAIARFPTRIAAASVCVRLVMAALVLIPSSYAIYVIFFVTDSSFVVGIGVALLVATAWLFSASIWPAWLSRVNPSFKRDALKRAP